MNIVAIIGSPRGMQGNTGRLLEELLAGAREEGGRVEIVPLVPMKLQPCVACDRCHVTGVCPLKDDFESLKSRLLACDGFVLASPNYIFSVSAQMKALFDRMNGMLHCLALEGKYGAVVETSGGGGDDEVTGYMERVMGTLGALSVGAIGSAVAGARVFPDQEKLFACARELGRELCRCIREKRRFREQEEFIAGFRERMEGLVGYMQEQWTFEHTFWQEKRAGR